MRKIILSLLSKAKIWLVKSHDTRFFLRMERMSSIRWKCIFWQITIFFFWKEKSNIYRISEAMTRNSQNFFLPVDTRGLANCYKNHARFSNPTMFYHIVKRDSRREECQWVRDCSSVSLYICIDWTREKSLKVRLEFNFMSRLLFPESFSSASLTVKDSKTFGLS